MNDIHQQIQRTSQLLAALEQEKAELQAELDRLRRRLPASQASHHFSAQEKIDLFMSLFRGRDDVFARRWDNPKTGASGYAPACHNEWMRGVCGKPQIKCGECPNQAFMPVTAEATRRHLAGELTLGVYPMLKDETCWFLAVDFDREHWQRDARAFLDTCARRHVPAALERSRSGNGGHVWIFFSAPLPAREARKMGAALLTETMEYCPDIGFESYDRFFPNQDTLPAKGFGNLIALPLQRQPREKGNSLFLDSDFAPYPDQWTYLSSLRRMMPAEVNAIANDAALRGRILGVRMPLDEEDQKPWEARPSRGAPEIPIGQVLPPSVECVLGNQLYIAKQGLPPALATRLIRLAAFQNPAFYLAQAMRLSTFGIPRIIATAEDFPHHIALPRGCVDEALALFKLLRITIRITDKRYKGSRLAAPFTGTLAPAQERAAKAMLAHDTGVLAATTAFGKTVLAAHIIAARKTNTLVLVHRRQLLDQWIARLRTFLDIPHHHIGMIAGGKRKPTGIIDVALMQSLARKGIVDDVIADYGQVIVDECHHVSAVSFEALTRAAKAKYVLGLTATATRKDGRHPIIFMQCGPIRYKVDPKSQALLRPFTHRAILRHTAFQPFVSSAERLTIQQLYAAIAADAGRNLMITEDVIEALAAKRSPLLLTERKEHAKHLATQLAEHGRHVVVMTGGQGAKQREQIRRQLASIPDTEPRLLIATGRYIGEGFDDARLDTLFLAMPISWHGTLAQYAGRLHRLHHAKKDVIIYDYVDDAHPMLDKMAEKRRKGYERLGYEMGAGDAIMTDTKSAPGQGVLHF